MPERDYSQEDMDDPFGMYAHDDGHPLHSGNCGHYCNDWDGLWICEDCEEFAHCHCEYKKECS